MASIDFLYNLQASTYSDLVLTELRPAGYLSAPNSATGRIREYAREIRRTRRALLIDNGNFVLIGNVASEFRARARPLWESIRTIEDRLDRTVRRGEVPADLEAGFRALAREVRERCQELIPDADAMETAQLALDPTAMVGVEDITMASWLALDLEPTYTRLDRRDYRRQNERVARIAAQRQDAPPTAGRAYYPVASAVSYDTAWDAGRAFGRAGIPRASMGFGAYMVDQNFTDHVYVGRRRIDLGARVPRRYARTVLAARGFWDGYREATGTVPEAFHFLGLGTPKMMALVTLCAFGTERLTFDATSPIKDSSQGVLYVSRPSFQKVNLRKVAYALATTAGRAWDCPCPFCTSFAAAHPFDYARARAWAASGQRSAVQAPDLRPGGALYDAFPLFSEPAGGDFRGVVSDARIGHNHWVIEGLLTSLGRVRRDEARLLTRVTNIVEDYAESTNSSTYATALTTSLALATMPLA